MGGPLLWPAEEPWPVCTRPHSGNWELAEVPREITSWDEAAVWACATLGPQAKVGTAWRADGGPAQALIDRSRPPEIVSPMISVLQLRARDIPGMPFPEGTDCFQLLWCPNHHPPGRYPCDGFPLRTGTRSSAANTTRPPSPADGPPCPGTSSPRTASSSAISAPCTCSPAPRADTAR